MILTPSSTMTADRRAQIIQLLASRNDWTETVYRDGHGGIPARKRSHFDADSGPVHNVPDHQIPCEDCLTNDRIMPGCATCGGHGWVRAPRTRDPMIVDKVMPYGWDADWKSKRNARDAKIDRLAAQREPPKSEADLIAETHPYGWEDEADDYDYRSLDRALAQLLQVDFQACSLLIRVYEYGTLPAPHEGTEMAVVLDRGLAFVDKWMPNPIRAPGGEPAPTVGRGPAHRNAGPVLVDRDREIADQVLVQGMSSAEVAVLAGLSVRRVNEIVQKHSERSAA